jgi:hypothetical protein
MSDRKDRTILDNWKLTGELARFILDQEGLTHLDDWGGKEMVREILPEDYQANFDIVQTDLVNTILKDKNRGSANAFINNIMDYTDWGQRTTRCREKGLLPLFPHQRGNHAGYGHGASLL